MVFGDIFGILIFISSGILVREYIYTVPLIIMLIYSILIKKNSKEYQLEILTLVFLGLLLSLSTKPLSELVNISYPLAISLAIFIGNKIKFENKYTLLFILTYIIISLNIDYIIYDGNIHTSIIDYYSNRGYQTDDDYILPGISTRRYIVDIIPFRLPGAALDPLANGIILSCVAFKISSYFKNLKIPIFIFFICIIFILTESRSSIIFSVLLITITSLFGEGKFYNKNLIITFIGIFLIGFLYIFIGENSDEDSHVKGLLFQNIDYKILLGVGNNWLSPVYTENGIIFLLSGVGLISIPLLVLWIKVIRENIKYLSYICFLCLMILLPVHYYIFNIKILSSILLIFSNKKCT